MEQESTTPKTEEQNNSSFECNICLENATDPVISMFISSAGSAYGSGYATTLKGHGIHQNEMVINQSSPVCKSVVSKEKLIPIYGRGKEQRDPREATEIPQRPTGQRTEPRREHFHHQSTNDFPFGSPFPGYQYQTDNFSFQFGLFPSLFGLTFTNFPNAHQQQQQPNRQPTQEELNNLFMSRILLIIGILLILRLISF